MAAKIKADFTDNRSVDKDKNLNKDNRYNDSIKNEKSDSYVAPYSKYFSHITYYCLFIHVDVIIRNYDLYVCIACTFPSTQFLFVLLNMHLCTLATDVQVFSIRCYVKCGFVVNSYFYCYCFCDSKFKITLCVNSCFHYNF